MSQTCTKCSRVNPPEAAYCYYDGAVLGGLGRIGGPVSVATQLFANPFVFPSGRSCRNFDELALACHENWREACDLLNKGFLNSFFGALGRADLAAAARDAARFPDGERALDQLLGQLPSSVLAAGRLRVEPMELNLGTMQVGSDRAVQIHLHNQGMRLLYGTVTCDECPWLSIGDTLGTPQRHFQFDHESAVSVHVRGAQLRAAAKPLEGRLIVESNGGSVTIPVRVEVPVKAFPTGQLAGAKSPRQVAEKARSSPKEAAVQFESGEVAQWYKDNGWTYPVQGPSASGLGAVQQFFEALGLTEPPKVDVSERSVILRGDPGHQLRHVLRVETREKRPVYAYGKSNQAWLEVGKPQLNGRVASIPLVIPNVPHRPGETLTAKVRVHANGNQRFTIPVTLEVGTPPESVFDFNSAAPPAEPAPIPKKAPEVRAPTPVEPVGVVRPSRRQTKPKAWGHLVPALLLLLTLGGIVAWDLATKGDLPPDDISAEESSESDILSVEFAKDADPLVGVEFSDGMRFGIQMSKEPDPANPEKRKRLTYEERGESNNTRVKIDGKDCSLGRLPGEWLLMPKDLVGEKILSDLLGLRDNDWKRIHRGRPLKQVDLPEGHKGWLDVWQYPEKVRVYQQVELVVGEQTGRIDTVLVHYTVENHSTAPHTVGLRIMLDTFIGANDGVPFTIPGQKELVTTKIQLSEKDIPEYLQALERGDLNDPGTVAHMGLKGFKLANVQLEPIDRLVICRWESSHSPWDWDFKAIDDESVGRAGKDSCVLLYWDPQSLEPGLRRDMAFTYGLNRISATGSGSRLGLTAGGSFRINGEFRLTAYIRNPEAGQRVKLEPLPDGLKLVEGQKFEQEVFGGGEYNQVSWRIQAKTEGKKTLAVSAGTARVEQTVTIRGAGGLFQR
jgi:hypothetical protein